MFQKVGLDWGGDWVSPVDKPHFYLGKWGDTTTKLKKKYGTPQNFKKYWTRKLKKKTKLYKRRSMKASKVLKKIPKGKKVKVLRYSKLGYAKVKYGDKYGFVYRKNFEKVK